MSPPADTDFDVVDANSAIETACSPDPDLDFRGILIQAPKRVLFDEASRDPFIGGFARVILCGAYHLDSSYLDLHERFADRLVLVAIDARTHRGFIGRMASIPNKLPQADAFAGKALGPSDLEGRSVIEYFNPNLAQALSLPEGEADYYAYAALGAYVSNVVRIEVRRRGGRP